MVFRACRLYKKQKAWNCSSCFRTWFAVSSESHWWWEGTRFPSRAHFLKNFPSLYLSYLALTTSPYLSNLTFHQEHLSFASSVLLCFNRLAGIRQSHLTVASLPSISILAEPYQLSLTVFNLTLSSPTSPCPHQLHFGSAPFKHFSPASPCTLLTLLCYTILALFQQLRFASTASPYLVIPSWSRLSNLCYSRT